MPTTMPAAPALAAPSLALLGMEPFRAAFEYASMFMMDRHTLPEGDGHPIIIFPGLASDKRSLLPLRQCCEGLGYTVYDWERGFNTGPQGDIDEWLHNLADHVRGVSYRHKRRVSMVGWSLGGIYAREIAKLHPHLVRQVITLGTPFRARGGETNVGWLYRLVNGNRPLVDDELSARLCATPPVPTTAIYSRSDGVVAWQTCVMDGQEGVADNVEIEGSHMGMPWNPQVLRIVAQRLAGPESVCQVYDLGAQARAA